MLIPCKPPTAQRRLMAPLRNWCRHTSNAAVLAAIGLVLVLLILPATIPIRDDGPWLFTGFSLKNIGLAFHDYHQDHGSFPSSAIFDKDCRPLLSWRVALLPYLEENELYSQFRLDEPWDSPNNRPLL